MSEVVDGFATAEVAQAARDACRVIERLQPAYPGARVYGPAGTCSCGERDNLALHRALASAPAGSVLVAAAGGRSDGAYFGELMALDARNRGIAREGMATHELQTAPGTPNPILVAARVIETVRARNDELAATEHPWVGAETSFLGEVHGGDFYNRHREVTGSELVATGVKVVADGAIFQSVGGIPTVYHGPPGEGAHADVESIAVDELGRSARIYVALFERLWA